jgi:NAD(P)-dependent dehydrogenase (short-subunit alcohol dehydrogenase family)
MAITRIEPKGWIITIIHNEAQRIAKEKSMGRLKGKIALITGGNSGIGLATARLFVAEGAKVILTGRNQKALNAAAEELGPNAAIFKMDVLDGQARKKVFATIQEKFDRLDIVFANAGTAALGSIAEMSEETFDQTMRTNVTGVFLTVQAALPFLRAGSSVILNGSIAGRLGFLPGAGAYSASKEAISALSRSMAAELSPRGIRVNVVAPGFTKTPIWTDTAQATIDKLQTGIPLNRWGEADEIAKAVLFLACDDSSYVNISEIVVDGGVSGALFAAPNWRS